MSDESVSVDAETLEAAVVRMNWAADLIAGLDKAREPHTRDRLDELREYAADFRAALPESAEPVFAEPDEEDAGEE